MSDQTNSFPSPLSDEIVKNIDQLNLPIIKKHHVRLLAHCLEIFKEIGKDETSFFTPSSSVTVFNVIGIVAALEDVENANKMFHKLHGITLNSASLSRNNAVLVKLGLIKLAESSTDRRQKDIIFTTVGVRFRNHFNDIPKAKEAI